ncbi:MAG: LamG-like jellyroll fold domain-containing protein [Armatimonadota bacterium]
MMRIFLLLLVFCVAVAALAVPVPGEFGDGLDCEAYDCLITARQPKGLAPTSALTVYLEWSDDANHTAVVLTPKGIALATLSDKKELKRQLVDTALPVDAPFNLTIMRRGGKLGLALNSRLIFRGEMPRAAGTTAGITVGEGWTVEATRVQPLEPVLFADNFMRNRDEPGPWSIISGKWGLQSAWDIESNGRSGRFANQAYATNPFAWIGSNPNGAAVCTAGKPFWEDYTLTTALCPPVAGAAGVLVNLADRQNGLLIRWSPANDRADRGNELALFRLIDGKRELLTRSAGGYLSGQWYRMSVESSPDGVRVLIDGVERLTHTDAFNWRGGVGLYAEGAEGAVFDDLTVYGRRVNTTLFREEEQRQLSQRMLNDPVMVRWSRDWQPFPGQQFARVCTREFYGDHGLAVTLTPSWAEDGELWLGLNGNGQALTRGYRVSIKRAAGREGTDYTVYRNTVQLAAATGEALQPGDEYRLRFQRVGKRIWLEVDGETVVSAEDESVMSDLLPFYWSSGCLVAVREPMVSGNNVLDYYFTEAPVDWVGEGTWAPTIRWACDPKWSFMSGWSHGLAVLWHKREFRGDHSLEVYMGVKMEYPRYREFYDFRFRDLALTICSDGRDPRSGYTGIVGAPDEQGTPNRRTVLLRNGVVVASVNLPLPQKDQGHNSWFLLSLRKRGNAVDFLFDGKPVIHYVDEQPLEGGVPAIWTKNNGVSLARARLQFAEPSRPRPGTQVGINEPEYPDWVDAGKTLALSFPAAGSTTGNPVRLEAKPIDLPGKEAAPVIKDTQVLLTPTRLGDYWYKINAVDGDNVSPSVHVVFPVFTPALGRDDSRTLLMYRFTEGKGNVVKDRCAVGQPLDLHIPTPQAVRWLSGQGLMLLEPTMLSSNTAADKLLPIKRGGTFECWISATTLYPQTGTFWEGTLFSWDETEGAVTRRNFAVGFHSWMMLVAAGPGSVLNTTSPFTLQVPGLRLGLRHVVVTWNGTKTVTYMNGVRVAENNFNWRTDLWSQGGVIHLGNQVEEPRTYLGTYYLLAIHDRPLTAEQVLRHYQAGPSAR